MTSFLFQFQFSQKISHFSIAKFTKILRQHTCFFVPKKCLILGPVLSFLDQIFVMWRCSMPFFSHFLFTICWHSWSVWMLHTCWTFAKFASWSLSYQSLFFVFFLELNPWSLSYQVCFCFLSVIFQLLSYQNLFVVLELTQSSPRSLSYQVSVLQKSALLKFVPQSLSYWVLWLLSKCDIQ